MGGGSFENMVGKNIFKEEKKGRRKRVLGKGKKGVRNIIFGFGNGKIVMKTAVLPFLFCMKKENYTLS